jgi:hypothetical protein
MDAADIAGDSLVAENGAAPSDGEQPGSMTSEGVNPDILTQVPGPGTGSAHFSKDLLSSSHMHQRENATTALNLAAPLAIVLGPEALQAVYEPVFGPNPRRGSTDPWFTASAYQDRSQSNPHLRFFSPQEYSSLGGTLIQPIWETRDPSFTTFIGMMKPRPELNSDYITTLRKFLGDACRNLLASEMSSTDPESNLLFSGTSLDAVKTTEFFRKLSGLPKGAASNIDLYITSFPDLLPNPLPTTNAARTNALRIAYTHLCVALASDSRVITR